MPDLSELLLDKSDAVIEFPGADISVTYRPSAYSRALEARLLDIEGNRVPETELARECADVLSALVIRWDLTKGGEPLATEAAEIADNVPIVIALAIVQKLHQELAGEAVAGRKTQNAAQPTPLANRAERRAAARQR